MHATVIITESCPWNCSHFQTLYHKAIWYHTFTVHWLEPIHCD